MEYSRLHNIITQGQKAKAGGCCCASEIKRGTIKLRRTLMAGEANLKLALVPSAEVRRSAFVRTRQTGPLAAQSANKKYSRRQPGGGVTAVSPSRLPACSVSVFP